MNILISAGPTLEPIDAVRFISNRSSGIMGRALALAASNAGYAATVVHGPMPLPLTPCGTWVAVETGREMLDALRERLPWADVLIMAAAVCDFRPVRRAVGKLDKTALAHLELEPVVDILAALGVNKGGSRIISFSLENDMDGARPLRKLKAKQADWCVINPVASMGAGESLFRIIDSAGRDMLEQQSMSKDALAGRLMQLIGQHWGG